MVFFYIVYSFCVFKVSKGYYWVKEYFVLGFCIGDRVRGGIGSLEV